MKYAVRDFDGTLAERDGMWSGALAEVAAAAGFEVSISRIRKHFKGVFPLCSQDPVGPR